MSATPWLMLPLRVVDRVEGPDDLCQGCQRPLLTEQTFFDGGPGRRRHDFCVDGWFRGSQRRVLQIRARQQTRSRCP